jgi:hypothetical protein
MLRTPIHVAAGLTAVRTGTAALARAAYRATWRDVAQRFADFDEQPPGSSHAAESNSLQRFQSEFPGRRVSARRRAIGARVRATRRTAEHYEPIRNVCKNEFAPPERQRTK